jgi:hypothetical protein
MQTTKHTQSTTDVIAYIAGVLGELEGDEIANVFNQVCAGKAVYLGDEIFEISPESANDVVASKLNRREAMADEVLASYKFGSDDFDDGNVEIVGQNRWNTDDKNDYTKVLYATYRDDAPNADSHKISFHVRLTMPVK